MFQMNGLRTSKAHSNLKYNFNKFTQVLTSHVITNTCSTIPLLDKSNLVKRSFYSWCAMLEKNTYHTIFYSMVHNIFSTKPHCRTYMNKKSLNNRGFYEAPENVVLWRARFKWSLNCPPFSANLWVCSQGHWQNYWACTGNIFRILFHKARKITSGWNFPWEFHTVVPLAIYDE